MTIPTIQIAFDAADPHALNRFWAAAVGYEVEDHHDSVTEVVEAGYATLDDAVEIDGRLAWKTAAASRDPAGAGPRLLFQQVPEATTPEVRVGKPAGQRIHLDLQRGFDDEARAAEVERLIGLGAVRLWDGEQGPHRWVTMADPEGNVFCVA